MGNMDIEQRVISVFWNKFRKRSIGGTLVDLPIFLDN